MNINTSGVEGWHRYSDLLAESTGYKAGFALPFLGVAAAVNELSLSMAQLYSHKTSIAVSKSPNFERLVVQFSRNGYRVQEFEPTQLQDPQDWIAQLNKDTLFVLFERDEAFTGELYAMEAATQALEGKKIFTIAVSHNQHFFRAFPRCSDHQVEVCSAGPGRAVALLGARVNIPSVFALSLPWKEWDISDFLKVQTVKSEKRQEIEQFEKIHIKGFTPLFKSEMKSRIYDRAAIHCEDVDGYSLISELSTLMNIKLQEPGYETRLEATSLCRWSGEKNFSWLVRHLGERSAQGLILISADLLPGNLGVLLQKSRENVLRMQG